MKLTAVLRTGLLSLATMGVTNPQGVQGVQGRLLPGRGDLGDAQSALDHHHRNHQHRAHPIAVRQIIQMQNANANKMDEIQDVVPSSVIFHDTNVTTTITTTNAVNTPTAGGVFHVNGTYTYPNATNITVNTTNTTTATTGSSSTGGAGWSLKPQNITICTAPTYEDTSPLRTNIYRDDCQALAKKVLARAGYWEMAQWTGLVGSGAYVGLATEGTCQFGVLRQLDEKLIHDQGSGDGGGVVNVSSSSAVSKASNTTADDIAFIGNQDVYNILHAAVYDLAYQADEPYMDKMTTQGRVHCQFGQDGANATLLFKLQYVDVDNDDGDDGTSA